MANDDHRVEASTSVPAGRDSATADEAIARDLRDLDAGVISLDEIAPGLGNPPELEPAYLNLLSVLRWDRGSRILLIGSRWGTSARYLSSVVDDLVIVEPDELHRHIVIGRLGSASLATVSASIGDLPESTAFDVVIVSAGDRRAEREAEEFAPRLANSGAVVLTSENPLGVSRLLRPGVDSFALQSRLIAALRSAGMGATRRLDLFPGASTPRVAMDSESLFREAPKFAAALAAFPPVNGHVDRAQWRREHSLWSAALENGVSALAANAHFTLVSRTPSDLLDPNLRAVYWSEGRREGQRARNSVRATASGLVVERRSADSAPAPEGLLVQFEPLDEAVVSGVSFVELLGSADYDNAAELLAEWRGLIERERLDGSRLKWDFVPHNLIKEDSGDLVAIDQEWTLVDGDWDVILRRGVFWLASRLAESGVTPSWLDAESIADAAVQLGAMIGFDRDGEWVKQFVDEESRALIAIWPMVHTEVLAEIKRHQAELWNLAHSAWVDLAGPPSKPRYGDCDEISEEDLVDGYVSLSDRLEELRTTAAAHRSEAETARAERDAARSERDDALAELESARKDLQEARRAEHLVDMSRRDYVIGIQAELATAREEARRYRLTADHQRNLSNQKSARISELKSLLNKARKTARSRAVELQRMRASRGWRVGRAIVSPFAVFRGRR